MKVMICLTSAQTMANIIPIKHFNPDTVAIIKTPEYENAAVNLAKFCKKKSIYFYEADPVGAYDIEQLKSAVKGILERYANAEIILNITGGTKLMAIAAFQSVFASVDVVYCNTDGGKIIYLSPEYKEVEIKADLSISDYLESFGYKILSTESIERIENFSSFYDWILAGNYGVFIKGVEFFRKKISDSHPKWSVSNGGLRLTKEFDKYYLENLEFGKIRFENLNFITGGWFEDYCYRVVKDAVSSEILIGVKISSKQDVHNEIDIMFIKDYKLYLVSCKAGKFDKKDIYEIQTMKDLAGGTFGKAYFLYADKIAPAVAQRAKELRITISRGDNIKI